MKQSSNYVKHSVIIYNNAKLAVKFRNLSIKSSSGTIWQRRRYLLLIGLHKIYINGKVIYDVIVGILEDEKSSVMKGLIN